MHSDHFDMRKFLPPLLPGGINDRPELMRKFMRAKIGHYLIVAAPAGFGKTVSTLLWLSDSSRKSVWINLDKYDDDLYAFYSLLCTGILSTRPDDGYLKSLLNDPAFKTTPVEQALQFFAACRDDGEEYVLVLEDMHSIRSRAIRASLPLVLRRLPHNFLTVFLSRETVLPDWILLKQEGAVCIGQEDLVFSCAELTEYLEKIRPGITFREAREIHQTTNGWPIGVVALSAAPVSRELAGNRILEHYFHAYLWPRCDEEMRRFILQCANADEMTEEICAELTGRRDAGDMLVTLYEKNFFMTRGSDGRFSFHEIILDIIRSLPEFSLQNRTEANIRLAKHYSGKGQHFKAVLYAEKSGDIQTIAAAGFISIFKHSNSFQEAKFYATSPSVGFFPEFLCREAPFLYISNAFRAHTRSLLEPFAYYSDKLRTLFDTLAEQYPRYLFLYYRTQLLDPRYSYYETTLWANEHLFSRIHDPENTLPSATYTHQLPLLHRASRDFSEMVDFSRLETCARINKQLAVRKNSPELYFSCIQAGLLLEKNQTEEALEIALHNISRTMPSMIHEIRFGVFMHLAATYEAIGDQEKLFHILAETKKYIATNFHFLMPNLLAFKTRIQLWKGDKDAAKEWLSNYFVHSTDSMKLYEIYQYATTLRAMIVLCKTGDAREFIHRCRRLLVDWKRFLDLAELDVLDAILKWHEGQEKESAALLKGVIGRLQPYGFTKIISDEGASVLPILRRVALGDKAESTRAEQAFLLELSILAQQRTQRYRGITFYYRVKSLKLSQQQKLVLSLLGQGLKYKEIASETQLTVHTVKYHLKEAYAKLRVHNAGEAILKARKLGFID